MPILDHHLSLLTLDEKNRVLLDREVRKASGLKKGAQLVAIPFKGGVILVDVTKKVFVGSMTGFAYEEEEHEASRFLFRES